MWKLSAAMKGYHNCENIKHIFLNPCNFVPGLEIWNPKKKKSICWMSTEQSWMLMMISLGVIVHSSMSPWGGGSLWKLHQLLSKMRPVLVRLWILQRMVVEEVWRSCNLCKRSRLGVEEQRLADAPPKTLQLDERKFDRKIMSPIIISPPPQLC